MGNETGKRIGLAIVTAIVVGLLVYALGLIINSFTEADVVGNFFMAISGLCGILAGVVYYITGRNPVA